MAEDTDQQTFDPDKDIPGVEETDAVAVRPPGGKTIKPGRRDEIVDGELIPGQRDEIVELTTEVALPDIPRLMEIIARSDKPNDGALALEKLVSMTLALDDRRAKREYEDAIVRFQDRCPTVSRNKTTTIKHKSGGSHDIKHTELDYMVITIAPYLKAQGLSYAWENDPDCPPDYVRKYVVISHTGGHSRRFLGSAFPVEKSSLCSPAQAVGIADTYSKRYTLAAGLGIVVGTDPDGQLPGETQFVTEEHLANLMSLIEEIKPDRERFMQHFGIDQFAHLPEDKYCRAVQMLYAKRAQGPGPRTHTPAQPDEGGES